MSFVSALKKIGLEALKIGGYVILGLQGEQVVQSTVAPQTVTGTDIFSRTLQIVTDVETAGATLSQGLSTPALSGPQKLAMATTLVAQELSKYSASAAGKIANVDLVAKSAKGFAQAAVDYLNAFDQGLVSVQTKGPTTTIPVTTPLA